MERALIEQYVSDLRAMLRRCGRTRWMSRSLWPSCPT